MKKGTNITMTGMIGLATISLALAALAPASLADDPEGNPFRASGYGVVVTITNLTKGQIISPPVAVIHRPDFRLFEPGQPASDELAALAEDGMTGPLTDLLEASSEVISYGVAGDGIMPGQSAEILVDASRSWSELSLAGMLVSSNDAFVGLSGERLPSYLRSGRFTHTLYAGAYDAGSEANTESCDHIPGPPCGSPGNRVTEGAEGYVYVHSGIHGTGGLDPAMWDWNNPVAMITIERAD
jgi:hypothetical protein